jgi:hypothetical protein
MGNAPIVPLNDDRQLISEIAMDIGKEMVAYLEVQYPDVFAVMNGGCKLSVRNHIHNDIMAALDTIDVNEIRARLELRRRRRREWLKAYRDIRKGKTPPQPSRDFWPAVTQRNDGP